MSRTKSAIAAVIAAISIISVGTLSACSNQQQTSVVATSADTSNDNVSDANASDIDPNAVAATINEDITITEGEIEDFAARYRTYAGADSEEAFATLLDETGSTPEEFRAEVIKQIASDQLVRVQAQEDGVSISDEEIDDYINSVKDGLGYATDVKSWKSSLDIAGYSEDSYRYDVETKLLLEKLVASNMSFAEATETEMMSYANSNLSNYIGANIVTVTFPASKGGAAASFARAASGMTEDEFISAANNQVDSGNANEMSYDGWTCINIPDSALLQKIATASASDAVVAQQNNGTYKVAYIKEVYMPTRAGRIEFSTMPSDIKAKLKSDTSAYNRSLLAAEYLDRLYEAATVVINEMPSGAAYNVDMSLSTYGVEDDSLSDEEVSNMTSEQVEAMTSANSK